MARGFEPAIHSIPAEQWAFPPALADRAGAGSFRQPTDCSSDHIEALRADSFSVGSSALGRFFPQ